MSLFERECTRLNIKEDVEKIEILRLFLENACCDWYGSMLLKNTLNSEWNLWKENFCETYADNGWTSVKYAISCRYINGSLLDYVLKKERLLLEMDKDLGNKIVINLIAAGLPNFLTDRINNEKMNKTEDLFNELRSLEHLIKKKTQEKNKEPNQIMKEKNLEKKPCKTCENMGKKNRFHLESACWFKNKENDENKTSTVLPR